MKNLNQFNKQTRKGLHVLCLFFLFVCGTKVTAQSVTVSGALAGNGTYADLKSAFAAINGAAQTAANINVDVTSSITETATAVLNTGAWASLSITPSGGAVRVVSGSLTGPLIDLNGASKVYINGLNTGGNGLTFSNANTANALTTTLRLMAGAGSNTVTNCTLLGSSTSATLGTVTFSAPSAAGNSTNTISNCNIGPAGSNFPVNGIYAIGVTGSVNINNAVQNCNIFDFFIAGAATRGIQLAAGNSAWTITGNKFYQTAPRIYTTGATHGAIQVAAGDNYVVSNNVIGYASSTGTGVYTMGGTVANIFIGINLAVGNNTASSVQGNTITAITLTTSGTTATGNGMLCGISISAGSGLIGTSASNIIGGTSGTDLIQLSPGNGGAIVGINSASTGTITITNNYIGGATASGTSAAIGGGMLGINISGITTSLTINTNTVGNTTANNLRVGIAAQTTVASTFMGINFASTPTGTIVVNGNLVRNVANYGTAAGVMRGIYTGGTGSANTFSVVNNTISNLTTDNVGTNVGNGQLSNGGLVITAGASNRIGNNTIFNLSCINTATNTGVVLCGIATGNSAAPFIFSNKIYGLSHAGTSTLVTAPCMVFGVFLRSAAAGDCNIYNNMISLGDGQSTNTSFIGVDVFGGGTAPVVTKIYHNTINISGVVTTGAQPSFGIFRGDFSATANTFSVDIKNNLISNTRTGGTGSHFAIANNYGVSASNTTGWPAVTSNNNVLNGNAATIGWWTGNQTFAGWKTASGGDAASYSGISVIFVNPANDLHLNMGVTPTSIESNAQTIAGITDDIDGQVRPGPAGSTNGGGVYPDIGADEIDAVFIDSAPPVVTATGFATGPCSLSGRTFTATIMELSGVASGAVAPRIYYKVNAGAYSSVSGTLTSGVATNGIWSFNMVYTAALNDIISYYMVAQDMIGFLTAVPNTGFAGTDVNTITTPPTTPLTYTVNSLNGVYQVGAGGTFTTLTSAAYAYNNYCLAGPVTFSLTDALYSTLETYPIVFTNTVDASPTKSLLVRPGAGVAVALTPTNTTIAAVIKFLNARYITMDGINTGGSSMAVNNANVSSASANIWLASSGLGSNNIGIKNLALKGGYTNGSNGVIASVDGALPSGTGGVDNDNITITGNSFQTFYQGILAVGTTSISAGGMDNWVISNNLIGPAASGTAIIGGNGIVMLNAVNLTITANQVRNVWTTVVGADAINMNGNITGLTLSQNTITNIFAGSTGGGVNAVCGVYLGPGISNGTVNANVLSTIASTNISGYGARGIIVNTNMLASNLNILNNAISNIYCYPDVSPNFWPIGISVDNTGTGVNIDFNSVHLSGSYTGYASATGSSAAMYIGATGGGLNIRNNIFNNTYDNTTYTTEQNFGIYSAVANTNFGVINYNDYYVAGATSVPVLGFLGSNQLNLAGIQTAFGGNVNSKNVQPVFTSATDLHMQQVAGNLQLENTGLTVAGVTTDMDGQTRSLTTPDIGADEFTIPVCTTANGGVLGATSATACAGQTLVATSTGVSTGLTTTYLWKVGTTSGGPYVPVTGGTGSTTTSYTSAPLPTGVYFIVLETTCGNTSQVALSNQGTLTVNAVPTASATSATTLVCSGQNINLTGASNIGTTYQWNGPNGFASTSQNTTVTNAGLNAAGIYSLSSTVNNCTSTLSTISVTVNATPSAITLTPASANLCAGGSQTIGANGGGIQGVFNFTPQVNQNTNTTYPACYSAYYGGQKMQFLVLASELTAQGLVAGPLTSIRFPVVSRGANWGGSITSNQNFQVSLKLTPLTFVGATFETGLTVVAAATNFTPTVGYNNTHNFGTAFNWDGTSNLIVETVFSNNFSGLSGDGIVQYYSPTTFQSTMLFRDDNLTFAAMAGQTTTNSAVSLARPDFKLYGTSAVPMTWSPPTGLSGTTGTSVTATPAATTNYTVQALNAACSSSATINVSVTPIPTLSIAATPTAICVGDQATLTASGATSYTWNTSPTPTADIVVSPVTTTDYTVSNQTGPCPLVSETISLVVNPLPVVLIAPASPTVCSGTPITFTSTGADTYLWDATSTGSTNVVTPTSNTAVTVAGTDLNGCIGTFTAAIVTNSLPVVAVSPSTMAVCLTSPASFTASGATTYSWNNGSTNAVLSVTPTGNTSYTVTGYTSASCTAQQIVAATTLSLPVISVSPASATVCVDDVLTLTVTGAASYTLGPDNNTSGTFTVQTATSVVYTVTGTDANTCMNSGMTSITTDLCTGIAEKTSAANYIQVFPNPSHGLITAAFGFDGDKVIYITNSVGAVVDHRTTDNKSETFDLSQMAKGIYFVIVKSEAGNANFKVIIE